MAQIKLTTPIDEETIRSLNVGDTVSISGRLYTGRDAVHHRIHSGVKPPVDLAGQIIYHCGPVMVKEGDQWVCKAAGPTTSSREEPYQWEVMRDYGIRAVVSSAFSDIFQSNAVRNGLLPVVLPERVIAAMLAELAANPGGRVTVDLEAQTVTSPSGEVHYFEIDPFSRHCLREGLDEVSYTLSLEDKIAAFEKGRK